MEKPTHPSREDSAFVRPSPWHVDFRMQRAALIPNILFLAPGAVFSASCLDFWVFFAVARASGACTLKPSS